MRIYTYNICCVYFEIIAIALLRILNAHFVTSGNSNNCNKCDYKTIRANCASEIATHACLSAFFMGLHFGNSVTAPLLSNSSPPWTRPLSSLKLFRTADWVSITSPHIHTHTHMHLYLYVHVHAYKALQSAWQLTSPWSQRSLRCPHPATATVRQMYSLVALPASRY